MADKLLAACDMLAGGLRLAIEEGRIDTKSCAPVFWGMIEEAEAAIEEQRNVLAIMPRVCACCNSIPTHECTTCHMTYCAEHSDFCRNCGSETPMRISEDQIIRYARRLQSLCKKAAHVIREMEDNHRAGKPGFSADDEDFGRFVAELEDA